MYNKYRIIAFYSNWYCRRSLFVSGYLLLFFIFHHCHIVIITAVLLLSCIRRLSMLLLLLSLFARTAEFSGHCFSGTIATLPLFFFSPLNNK